MDTIELVLIAFTACLVCVSPYLAAKYDRKRHAAATRATVTTGSGHGRHQEEAVQVTEFADTTR